MSITVDLTPDQEKRLRRRARAARMAPADYVRDLILRQPDAVRPTIPMSNAEFFAYWEANDALGAFADGPDSPELARQLRQAAARRDW
ncbi:MAG: hypothetical protein FJX72_12340 [Armatimonadetes bacterium]|nr:hypothetical protein [Armatimonadota bacterium]